MHSIDGNQEFSVLMSIYAGNKFKDLNEALLSIKSQTLLPSEVVIVEDGYVDDKLKTVVGKYRNSLHIVSVVLDENTGHGHALNQGLKFCSNDLCKYDI